MKTILKTLAGLVLLLAIAASATAYLLNRRIQEPYRGYTGTERIITIPRGAATRSIGQELVAAGIIRDELSFRAALWSSGLSRRLQAGEYRFERPLSAVAVLEKIARGDVLLIPITFPEGLTIAEMAQLFGASGFGTAEAFLEAAQNRELIASLDPDAADLEGYLFPDTYALPRSANARQVVAQMVDRFKAVLTDDLKQAAAARGLSVRKLVTLASLVEEETARPDERPTVAAVYSNRLRLGMGLQCDPTVIYALQKAGQYTGNLRRVDLMFDSPYNTYRYPGLPPGPIAAPGSGSLAAAARPADVDYLYFVSRNDGSHEFARTLAEHNRNVQRYQIQYFRDRRRAAAAGTAP